jgi:hypothetical protein
MGNDSRNYVDRQVLPPDDVPAGGQLRRTKSRRIETCGWQSRTADISIQNGYPQSGFAIRRSFLHFIENNVPAPHIPASFFEGPERRQEHSWQENTIVHDQPRIDRRRQGSLIRQKH